MFFFLCSRSQQFAILFLNMEILVQGVLCAMCWAASLTILLPFVLVLKFSKSASNIWFSWFFSNFISSEIRGRHRPLRKRAFELLEASLPPSKSGCLDVLEIGIGGGENLQFYQPNVNLTALDMNESFKSYFLKNLKDYPEINVKDIIIAKAENMKGKVEDCSMDVVVSTLVLCSVTDVQAVLSEVKRVLKPGGKFILVEHSAYLDCKWRYALQLFAAPIWKIYFNGCIVGRDPVEEIKKAGFSNVISEVHIFDTPFIVIRPHTIALVEK